MRDECCNRRKSRLFGAFSITPRYGKIENNKEVADFEAILARYKLFIAYFGLNHNVSKG